MNATTATSRPPRRHVADLVIALSAAGIALERLERQRHELTGPRQLAGVMNLRPVYDVFEARARYVLARFADDRPVEGPGRAGDAVEDTASPLSGVAGAPERRAPLDTGCPELAEGQIWLSCYAADRWRVDKLNPCPGEGSTVLLRALDGPHQGKTVPVRVGDVRDQALLLDDPNEATT